MHRATGRNTPRTCRESFFHKRTGPPLVRERTIVGQASMRRHLQCRFRSNNLESVSQMRVRSISLSRLLQHTIFPNSVWESIVSVAALELISLLGFWIFSLTDDGWLYLILSWVFPFIAIFFGGLILVFSLRPSGPPRSLMLVIWSMVFFWLCSALYYFWLTGQILSFSY